MLLYYYCNTFLRTSDAYVSRSWTYEGERQRLDGPEAVGFEKGTQIFSPVSFIVDESEFCPPNLETDYPKKETFTFVQESSSSAASVELPWCFLDAINNVSKETNAGSKTWTTNAKVNEYTQPLPYGYFWHGVDVDSLTIVPGVDLVYEFNITMRKGDNIFIEVALYDDSKIYPLNNVMLQASESYVDKHDHAPDGVSKLMNVEILDQQEVSNPSGAKSNRQSNAESSPSGDNVHSVNAALRLTVMTSQMSDVSGIMYLNHEHDVPLTIRGRIDSLSRLKVTKAVAIKSPDRDGVFPEGILFAHLKKR